MDLFNIHTRKSIVLRPYQEEAIEALNSSFEDSQSCLMVMATGLGKTVTATEFLRRRGGRSIWVAHRSELIEQASATIADITGVVPQTEMANQVAATRLGGDGAVVASVQTLNAKRNGRKRFNKFIPSVYNTLITDEAHHAVAKSWLEVSKHFCKNPLLKHLGMTATPDRGDAEALGQVYDECAYKYDIVDGVEDGWLVPIQIQSIYVDEIDLSVVGKVAGDLNQGELAQAMERDEALFGVADAVVSESGDRRTLIFTSSVKHAKALTSIINSKKPGTAAHIDGNTPKEERKNIIDEYRAGNFQYLCNVGIATEGFDVPNIGCVAIARPTMSRSLYTQMVGRGTRPLAGTVDGLVSSDLRRQSIHESNKPSVLIMDFVGNSGKHKLVSASDVLGGNYSNETVAMANKMAKKIGKPVDTIELLKKAESAVQAERKQQEENKLRESIRSKTKYRKKGIDPFDLLDVDPPQDNSEWNAKPLTFKQQQWLIDSGFDTALLTVSEQRTILNNLINRKVRNLATPKQIKVLRRYGYKTKNLSFNDASSMIDKLAKNNWRRI